MAPVLHPFLLVWLVIFLTTQFAQISDSESFDLNFLQHSNGYAITDDIPDMMSFSVCFWVKLVYPAGNSNTMALFSYSNSKFDRAYLLDTQGLSINIYMDDQNVLFPPIDLTDEKWHHACIMWDQANPRTSAYFDGVHKMTWERSISYRKEKVLKGGGTLILGAKREGGLLVDQMDGSLSNLNIWNKYLTADEVQNVYRACDLNRGNVLYWCGHVIRPMLRNNVTMVTPSTACSTSYAYGKFTSQENYKLIGHKITQSIVREEFVCASYCLRTCQCQSFNLRKRPDGQYLCHLNSATDKEFPEDFEFISTGHGNTYHAFVY